jgi:tetratricopeptide (TPR) repeat protein
MGYGNELPKDDYIINKKHILYIAIGITILIVSLGIYFLIPESNEESIAKLYDLGNWAINNGDLNKALEYYSKIIDIAPNEEKAWHEKGKILNRLKICEEALNHYEKYVINFPNSSRAQEGYIIAKNCN